MTENSIPSEADVVIVGGGVAGLYCAWRYLQHRPDESVVVLERLNRPGGRLQTDLVDLDAPDGMEVVVRDEEGGMRFNYEMKELMALLRTLGLCDQIVPFPMTGTNNRNLFRGSAFTDEQAAANPHLWSELYRLAPREQNRQPVDIVTEAYHRVLAANGATAPEYPTPQFWQTVRNEYSWDGTRLNRWQLWGLLRNMGYTDECCAMLAHTLGFEGPFWSLANAGEAFQILEDFPADPTYFTFENGYSTVVDALVEAVEEGGGRLFVSTNVDALLPAEGRGFVVQATQAPEYRNAHPSTPGGHKVSVAARRLILALPRKPLAGLFATSPVLNHRHSEVREEQESAQRFWHDLQSVVGETLLKINLYFESSWWQGLDLPLTYGPSFTDLPLNAVYPFYSLRGVEQDRADTSPPVQELPAALTIYCDGNNADFWIGLQSVGEAFDSPEQRAHDRSEPQVIFPASRAVVDEALRLFGELFNLSDVPRPVLTSFRAWDGEHDFGYAYHQWGLGAEDDRVIPRMVNPFPEIYTCNEAYSDMQGWVNGSLRSADLALEKLGITPLADDGKACKDDWNREKLPRPASPEQQLGGLWGLRIRPAANDSNDRRPRREP